VVEGHNVAGRLLMDTCMACGMGVLTGRKTGHATEHVFHRIATTKLLPNIGQTILYA
jgi:hypothetical protein